MFATRLFLFIVVTVLIGCYLPDSNKLKQLDRDKTDQGLKYVVVTHDCNFHLELSSIRNNQLVGSWIDSLVWFPSDSCFLGARPLERITSIEFYTSGRYTFREIYLDTIQNYTEAGEYWMYDKNDSCAVVLAEWYGDRPTQQGDTLIVHEWLIYSLDDNKLRMRSGFHQLMSPNVHEFKRIARN